MVDPCEVVLWLVRVDHGIAVCETVLLVCGAFFLAAGICGIANSKAC